MASTSRSSVPRRSVARDIADRRVRSANFGVLAAVQLHEVGVAAAARLCDVGVLAAVQLHDVENGPGEQLAHVPHPGHARERDSDGGGENRATEQREPADDMSHY